MIDDTSLELGKTGLVALLGPSGSGKTTLLNAIGGLDKIDSGEIYIDDRKMPKVGNHLRDEIRVLNIGYIFQDYNLLDNMSVFDNVAISLKMIGLKNRDEIKRRVDYILELVGMYRYRNKLAGNLSGGQRQRIGIARALVKNPDVIIADEPTGNLDSKNTIEIMNIIKLISKEKLVILVTHEKDLAHFYASRIVNLEDGKIVSDEENIHEKELDYRIDNKIYLKDFDAVDKYKSKANEVAIYSDGKEKLSLDIVVKNGNVFIKSRNGEKLEVIDGDSGIEFVDEHYQKIKKDDYESSEFDLAQLDNSKENTKYSSIYNLFTMLKMGFKKVSGYSMMKKILLIGFFFSAMFIMYSLASIFGAIDIKDEDFLNAHRDYIAIENKKNNVADFKKIERMEGVRYAIPGDSLVYLEIRNADFLQIAHISKTMSGSLAIKDMLKEDFIISGQMPSMPDEIVVDKSVIDAIKKEDPTISWLNLHDYDDFVGLTVNMKTYSFKIVGISDTSDPCIYFDKTRIFDAIQDTLESYSQDKFVSNNYGTIADYKKHEGQFKLIEGNLPLNDYEVLVTENYRDITPIGEYLGHEIEGKRFKVVGYYSMDNYAYGELFLVNANTVKDNLVTSYSNILIIAEDKLQTIDRLREQGYNAVDNYDVLKKKHINSIRDNIKESLVLAGVLMAISFVEIFLMIRASFLSRIKEVGIYRAIGVKKTDIYKMFLGEILIVTTIGGLPGVILMGSLLKEFMKIPYFGSFYKMNNGILLLGVVIIYLLNIAVGLMPIRSTIKRTPAEILSRTDVD